MKAGIISLGCPKNLVDTEFLLGHLTEAGWAIVSPIEEADLLIVNTCAFLEQAVEESREVIDELLAIKKEHPDVTVAVTGCLVNRLGRDLESLFPDVDIFFEPGHIPGLSSWLTSDKRPPGIDGLKRAYLPSPDEPRTWTTGSWAYLKISDGCSNCCAYCLIPDLRGPHRSRPVEDLVGEAAALIQVGVKEINLVGQDITRWGEEFDGQNLITLLEALCALPGQFRVRLLYLHPSRINEALIDFMAGHEHICPYLDMPIQHASDRVLSQMNRPYTRHHLEDIYTALRKGVPRIALRTTVMVGHPGEGRKEFDELFKFIQDHPFENLGAFMYSPEGKEGAGGLVDSPSSAESEERYHLIMSCQAEISRSLWFERIGLTTEALLINPVAGEDDLWEGRTIWQAPEVDGILRAGGTGRHGELVMVKIIAAGNYDLEGKVIGRKGKGWRPRQDSNLRPTD